MSDTFHPKQKGEITEAVIIAELLKNGITPLVPFGDNKPYDVVLENEHRKKFYKCQIKTGRLKNGVVAYNKVSSRMNSRGTYRTSYDGVADYFLIWCPDNDGFYAQPVDYKKSKYEGYLRVDAPKNNNFKNIVWAKDNLFLSFINDIIKAKEAS